jgi:hypothetical protein
MAETTVDPCWKPDAGEQVIGLFAGDLGCNRMPT